MGRDTHAVSGPAQRAALEVLAANGVETVIQPNDGVTPTPAVSRAILVHNRRRTERLADGIVVTPSHNPPEDGGFKYNPPNGGPADSDVTGWIQKPRQCAAARRRRRRAPGLGRGSVSGGTTHQEDFVAPYVDDLANVVDMDAIRGARLGNRRRSVRRTRCTTGSPSTGNTAWISTSSIPTSIRPSHS